MVELCAFLHALWTPVLSSAPPRKHNYNRYLTLPTGINHCTRGLQEIGRTKLCHKVVALTSSPHVPDQRAGQLCECLKFYRSYFVASFGQSEDQF